MVTEGILAPMKTNRLVTRLLTSAIVACLTACGGGDPRNTDGSADATGDAGPAGLSAVFETSDGAFEIELRPDLAPLSVMNLCNLVQRGFYHGKEISGANTVARSLGEHPRIPDYRTPEEYSSTLYFDRPGVVAWSSMPRSSETDDFIPHPTRFFMTVASQEGWNLQYVPFGTIVSGENVVEGLEIGDWILSARIKGDPSPLYEAHSEELARWNAALDAAGHQRAGADTPPSPGAPVSSN